MTKTVRSGPIHTSLLPIPGERNGASLDPHRGKPSPEPYRSVSPILTVARKGPLAALGEVDERSAAWGSHPHRTATGASTDRTAPDSNPVQHTTLTLTARSAPIRQFDAPRNLGAADADPSAPPMNPKIRDGLWKQSRNLGRTSETGDLPKNPIIVAQIFHNPLINKSAVRRFCCESEVFRGSLHFTVKEISGEGARAPDPRVAIQRSDGCFTLTAASAESRT